MPNGDPNQEQTGGPSAAQVIGSLFSGDILGGLKSIFSPRGGGFSGTESITGFEAGPTDPLAIARMDFVSAQEQHAVELRINKALISGDEPSPADLAELQAIKDFRTQQERIFQQQQAEFPARFAAFKIPFGAALADVLRLVGVPLPGDPSGGTGSGAATLPRQVGGGGGLPIPGRRPPPSAGTQTPAGPSSGGFDPATFIKCLIQSLLPIPIGGTRMPFSITPSFSPTPGSLDFGGFGGLFQAGINRLTSLISPPQSPASRFPELSTAGFPLLAPFTRGITRLAPSFGAGVLGGVAENFLGFGGASDLDESASFTDPIPGRCRPKAHVKINPCTGKGVWFTPRGKPLVFSGDMSACRRVDRVAKRLDKARPKRRHHHHPR